MNCSVINIPQSESKALQEKLQTAQEELTQFTEKYNDNLKTSEAERAIWAADKKTLEDTIVDLSTSEKHLEIDRTSREQESRQLEDRVKVNLLFTLPFYRIIRYELVRLLRIDIPTKS